MSDTEPNSPPINTSSLKEINSLDPESTNSDKDKVIKQSVDKQFSQILKNVHAVDFIAEFTTQEVNEYDYWDADEELKDNEVKAYLQRITALRIQYNRQFDDYRQNKPGEEEQQEKQRQIDIRYQSEARTLYKKLLIYPQKKEIDRIIEEYPDIDDYENENAEIPPKTIYRRYWKLLDEETDFDLSKDSGRLKYINVDAYIALASRIGEACSGQDEELFLTYLKDINPHAMSSEEPPTPREEKNTGVLRKEQEMLNKLKEVEIKARSYILEKYHTQLPEIAYEPFHQDMNAMQDFLLSDKEKPFLQTKGHFAFIRGQNSVAAYDDVNFNNPGIPKQLYVEYDLSDSFINNAEIVFEELYHASGLPLQQKAAERYWPGWRDDGTDSLLEEGLTAAEMHRFFEKNYPQEYHAPGSRNDIIVRYLRGEDVSGYTIKDVWPEVCIETLIKQLGKGSLQLMRSARANEPGSLETLQETIDDKLGEGTYDLLSKTNAKDRDKILMTIRKWKE